MLQLFNDDSRFSQESGKWVYTGVLSAHDANVPSPVAKAYKSWMRQGDRCNNPKDNDFSIYGGSGVRREWSSRECVNWYINELLKRDYWLKLNISRVGDIGNYSLENCSLLEQVENVKTGKNSRLPARNRYYNEALKDILYLLETKNKLEIDDIISLFK